MGFSRFSELGYQLYRIIMILPMLFLLKRISIIGFIIGNTLRTLEYFLIEKLDRLLDQCQLGQTESRRTVLECL